MGLTLRQDKGTKLSIKEMDDNFIYLNTKYVEVTRNELQILIDDNEIVTGQFYLITNAQESNINCVSTKVLLYGTSNKTISESGYRFQLIPDYSSVPMWWENMPDPNAGDKVIYGSRVWSNLYGSTGTTDGSFPLNIIKLDTNNWEEVPYEEGVNYTYKQIECVYDIENDLITQQILGSLTIATLLPYVDMFGFSTIDYCDWGQNSISLISDVNSLLFLNNAKLEQCISVFAPLFFNNMCEVVQGISVLSDKFTTLTGPIPAVSYNECVNLRSVTNTQSINGIPSSVNEYSFVTDDESGYIEHDFNDNPVMSEDTLVLGCIINSGVSIIETYFNSDGNLTPLVSFTFGILDDDPDYINVGTDDINNSVQKFGDISHRTSNYNRELILIPGGSDITSGKIYISYKYV